MIFFFRFVGFILVSFAFGCASESSQPIRIGYIPVIQALPLFVVKEEGLLEQEGLSTEMIRLENPQHGIDGLLTGNLDFLVAGATGIAAVASEKAPELLKIVYLMGSGKETRNDVLFTRKESVIRSIQDLRGRRLGLIPGIQFYAIARKILEANGIAINSVRLHPIPPHLQVQALYGGQIDALLSLEPSFAIAQSIFPVRHIEDHPMVTYISNPWFGGAGLINIKWSHRNPINAERLIRALARSIELIKTQPEKMKYHLSKHIGTSSEVIKQIPLVQYRLAETLSASERDAVNRFLSVFHYYGYTEKPVKFEDLIFPIGAR